MVSLLEQPCLKHYRQQLQKAKATVQRTMLQTNHSRSTKHSSSTNHSRSIQTNTFFQFFNSVFYFLIPFFYIFMFSNLCFSFYVFQFFVSIVFLTRDCQSD